MKVRHSLAVYATLHTCGNLYLGNSYQAVLENVAFPANFILNWDEAGVWLFL